MQFVLRLIGAVALGALVAVVIAAILLFVVWGVNRGLQYFLGLLGYEVGDFFGWIISKMGIKKKPRSKRKPQSEPPI